MPKRKVDKGVILAAGAGARFGPVTSTCPKVLLPVNGKALISYPIEALAAAEIVDIAIVVGYLAEKVVEALGDGSKLHVRLQYIVNPCYLSGNAISLHKAKDWVHGEPFVLCMGDHLVERNVIKRLLSRTTICDTLCVDFTLAKHLQLDEATKVAIDSAGHITDIGKNVIHWDAIDTGVFLLTENFFQALDELVPKLGSYIEISDVIRFLLACGHCFSTYDISGCFWADVDTEEILRIMMV